MRGRVFLLFTSVLISLASYGQKLTNMEWFNEPDSWVVENGKLVMDVTPQSDYWRNTHYGFTVDDGPFYYSQRGGEFEVTVKITGEYKTRFDQMGLMLRIDERNWIKTGIEFVDGKYNYSTVLTNQYSSWSVIELAGKPKSVWIKAIRRINAVEIFYSLDGENYKMSNLSYFPEHKMAMVGMMAASPDGNGFKAIFEDFKIKHLPDEGRLKWLENNK
jgi:regulation of enolase protein 1 (concanavalin A-like superfamily)